MFKSVAKENLIVVNIQYSFGRIPLRRSVSICFVCNILKTQPVGYVVKLQASGIFTGKLVVHYRGCQVGKRVEKVGRIGVIFQLLQWYCAFAVTVKQLLQLPQYL